MNNADSLSAKSPLSFRLALIFSAGITALSLLGLFWTPFDPQSAVVNDKFQSPNLAHWFGTDSIGRDLFSITLKGLSVTLGIALLVAAIGLVFGCLLGFTVAKLPILTSLLDLWVAFPVIILAFALSVTLGPSIFVIVFACSIGFAISTARIIAPKMRQLLQSDFVKNLQLMGASAPQIWFKHLLPNLAPLLIVQVSVTFVGTVLAEAGLTYLGLGVPNSMFSLGQILTSSVTFLRTNPGAIILPGLLIVLINLSVSTICDYLSSANARKLQK
jgi:peptide/nickel transport system permease protein